MVISVALLNKATRTNLFLDNIRQMPIMSKAISEIVAKFDDPHSNVCHIAINSLVELAKHGELCNSFKWQTN